MDLTQAFIIITGLAGQILVARRNLAGYWCWIAGNGAMIVLFLGKALYGMAALHVIYTAICLYAISAWRKSPSPAPTQA